MIKEARIEDASVLADLATQMWTDHNLEDLEADMRKTFTATNQSIVDAAALALVGTGWRVSSTMTKVRSVQQFKKTLVSG